MTTGKTGADAIFIAITHICRVIVKYQPKLLALINQLEAAHTLDSTQALLARNYISAASDVCAVFAIIAENSGF